MKFAVILANFDRNGIMMTDHSPFEAKSGVSQDDTKSDRYESPSVQVDARIALLTQLTAH